MSSLCLAVQSKWIKMFQTAPKHDPDLSTIIKLLKVKIRVFCFESCRMCADCMCRESKMLLSRSAL